MINKKTNVKLLVVTLAATFALAASAAAQSANVAVPTPTAAPAAGQGLLGSGYAGIAGDYFKLKKGPSAARGLSLYYNQPLSDGIDLTLGYDWARGKATGFKTTEQKIDAIVTGFRKESWGKPFVSAGLDWDHRHGDFANTGSSIGLVGGTGVEFQVAPAFALTPFVNFVRQTGFNQNEFDYGVKATYRLEHDWSITARAQYDDIRHSPNIVEYSVGLNYHF